MTSFLTTETECPPKYGASESQSKEVHGDGKIPRAKSISNTTTDDDYFPNGTQCLKCQFCCEILLGIFKLNKHLKKVHNARISITCNLCGEKFKRNKEFKKHLLHHQSSADGSSVKFKKKASGKKKILEHNIQRKRRRHVTKISSSKKINLNKREAKPIESLNKNNEKCKKLQSSPLVALDEVTLSGERTDPSQESESNQDNWDGCDDGFPESTNISDSELENERSRPISIVPDETCTVINSVTQVENKSDIEFLEETEPPRKTTGFQVFYEVNLFTCRECCMAFESSELASIHSTIHNLKVNAKFRCSKCQTYLSTFPEYQRHVKTRCRNRPRIPKKSLELHMHKHNSGDNRVRIFQCLSCAKTFPTLAALQAHHQLYVSHAGPAADPLEINPELEGDKIIQMGQPIKLSQGFGVEKISCKIDLMKRKLTGVEEIAKVERPKVEIPTVDQPAKNIRLTDLPTSGLSDTLLSNVKLKILETNKRKASRKEATSFVMYHGFEEDVVFELVENETSQPASMQTKTTHRRNRKSTRSQFRKTYRQVDGGLDTDIESSKQDLYCDRCDKTFTSRYKLSNHTRYHRVKNRYECGDCGRKFTLAKEYKGHLDIHKGLNPFKCPHCLKLFSSSNPLRRHIKTFHDPKGVEKRFRCTRCANRYPTQVQLREHMASHSTFVCETCGRKFHYSNEFEMHKGGHLGEAPLSCKLCNQRFSDKRKFYYHIRRHGRPNMRLHVNNPNIRAVSCHVCSARMSEAAFPNHMLKHQTGFKRPVACTLCDKKFATSSSKNRHLLSHPEFTGNICSDCYKEFPSNELLEDHKSQHPPKAKPICEVCGKCLATQYSLNQHMLRHGTEKPFQCHECGKVFRTTSYLRLHSYVHSQTKRFCCKFCDYRYKIPTLGYTHTLYSHFGHNGFQENDKLNREKTFFCEVCDEGFVKEASLQQHRIYHQATKTIKCRKQDCEEMFFTAYDRSYHTRMVHDKIICEFCGKDFRLKAELDQHRRYNHTGETPFDCHLCDKKYKTKPDLKYHIATHTGDYKFKCEFCEKKFISKANMHAHVRTHTDHKCRKCGVIWGTAKAWKVHKCEGKRLP